MNERRFISIPNQAINQLGAVSEVMVPKINVDVKRRDEIGIIKEEKRSYSGGLNPMHFSATFMEVLGRIFLQFCRERAMCLVTPHAQSRGVNTHEKVYSLPLICSATLLLSPTGVEPVKRTN